MGLEPGEVHAEADVRAVGERYVPACILAPDVEVVGPDEDGGSRFAPAIETVTSSPEPIAAPPSGTSRGA